MRNLHLLIYIRMLKNHLFTFLLLISMGSVGCSDDDNCKCDDASTSFELNQETGTIKYYEANDTWGISSTVPGTFDSVQLFLVDKLDKHLKKEGLQVKFNGKAVRSSESPEGLPSGYELYCLTITQIEEVK